MRTRTLSRLLLPLPPGADSDGLARCGGPRPVLVMGTRLAVALSPLLLGPQDPAVPQHLVLWDPNAGLAIMIVARTRALCLSLPLARSSTRPSLLLRPFSARSSRSPLAAILKSPSFSAKSTLEFAKNF